MVDLDFEDGSRIISQQIPLLPDLGLQYVVNQTEAYGEPCGFEVRTTPACSPESNGMVDAFPKLFKRDHVYVKDISTADSVRRRLTEWVEG